MGAVRHGDYIAKVRSRPVAEFAERVAEPESADQVLALPAQP
ncbi:MAG TPA: hypothetical protein VGF07_11135 [Stellaceae bacterium]|jgi:hypothetical protein